MVANFLTDRPQDAQGMCLRMLTDGLLGKYPEQGPSPSEAEKMEVSASLDTDLPLGCALG